MRGTRAVDLLCSGLTGRDVDVALAATSDHVVVEIEGSRTVVGREALRSWLQEMHDSTTDSRWLVRVSMHSTGSAPVVEDQVTVAWQSTAVEAATAGSGWVVVEAAVRYEVMPDDGPVRHVHVRADHGAVAAQLAGASRLPASSFRSEIALVAFDPSAEQPEPVRRIFAPPATALLHQEPRRRARRTAGMFLALALLIGVPVGIGVLTGPDRSSGLFRPAGVEPTSGPAAEPDQPAASRGADAAISSPEPSPAPPGPPLGESAVVEDDGTSTLSLSETVLFDTGSAALGPDAIALLDEVAATITDADGGRLLVVGHTDAIGSVSYNLRLSRDRAEAVADVLRRDLEGSGVTVTAEGRGAAEPIADQATPEGRQANRRVDLRYDPPPG